VIDDSQRFDRGALSVDGGAQERADRVPQMRESGSGHPA
jgi:hypothetical protein